MMLLLSYTFGAYIYFADFDTGNNEQGIQVLRNLFAIKSSVWT